ncbi:MAG: TetR/AcrR family transcriptional regulator [Microbacteriaceae bacterium]|nr:TetR/AcrR family transcriptional regulator [Microbacteriaceae bacterium]
MKAEDRRELVLAAATAVFGERGYFGATTDAVAKAAGVSQPYVVRMFGTKEALFLAVLTRALDRLLGAFRVALAGDGPAHPDGSAAPHRGLGAAYAELLADRGLLLSLMHGFILGSDTEIGACARAGFLQVYRFLREDAGFSADEVHEFLAEGMLLNTLVGIRMAVDYDTDPAARELLDTALPTKAEFLLALEGQRKPQA